MIKNYKKNTNINELRKKLEADDRGSSDGGVGGDEKGRDSSSGSGSDGSVRVRSRLGNRKERGMKEKEQARALSVEGGRDRKRKKKKNIGRMAEGAGGSLTRIESRIKDGGKEVIAKKGQAQEVDMEIADIMGGNEKQGNKKKRENWGDRTKSDKREVLIVCEDISQAIRSIKKEVTDGDENKAIEEERIRKIQVEEEKDRMLEEGIGMEVEEAAIKRRREVSGEDETDPVVKKPARRRTDGEEEPDGGDSGSPLGLTREVTRNIRRFVLSDVNKIVRWQADRILSQVGDLEAIIQNLALENAELRGSLKTYQGIERRMASACKSLDKAVSRVEEGVLHLEKEKQMDIKERSDMRGVLQTLTQRVEESNTEGRGKGMGRETGGSSLGPVSYALIVKGAREKLTGQEVKERIERGVEEKVEVKVRAMKMLRDGGVLVETATREDKERLEKSKELAEVGLKVAHPKKMWPRIMVFDVPPDVPDEDFLRDICRKGLSSSAGVEEVKERLKLIRRMKRGNREGRILELSMVDRDRLLRDGRVFVGWSSYRVAPWENIPRCNYCLSLDHTADRCKDRRPCCWNCGGEGHVAAACKAPTRCVNCWREGRHAEGHVAVSKSCPAYARRLAELRKRINNG